MNPAMDPKFESNAVPIVICFDNNYCLSGAALLRSIVKNSDPQKNYDIVILEDKVTKENQSRLLSIVKEFKNFSLRFFDINQFPKMQNTFTYGHFSAMTYARLFIPLLFEKYDKVIFIDSDTVVCTDPSNLLNVNLENHYVAGVHDIIMAGLAQFKVKSIVESGSQEASLYLKDKLGMDDPSYYFQAGVLVFNIQKIIKDNLHQELINHIGNFRYWFVDQDIMNKLFYKKVKYLPMEWNVYHGNGNMMGFFPKLKSEIYSQYMEARKSPKVIHFAGDQKPWVNPKVDFFDEFYKNIEGTDWELDLQKSLKNTSLLKKIKSKAAPLVNELLPIGSSRRIWVRNAYYKLNSFLK